MKYIEASFISSIWVRSVEVTNLPTAHATCVNFFSLSSFFKLASAFLRSVYLQPCSETVSRGFRRQGGEGVSHRDPLPTFSLITPLPVWLQCPEIAHNRKEGRRVFAPTHHILE